MSINKYNGLSFAIQGGHVGAIEKIVLRQIEEHQDAGALNDVFMHIACDEKYALGEALSDVFRDRVFDSNEISEELRKEASFIVISALGIPYLQSPKTCALLFQWMGAENIAKSLEGETNLPLLEGAGAKHIFGRLMSEMHLDVYGSHAFVVQAALHDDALFERLIKDYGLLDEPAAVRAILVAAMNDKAALKGLRFTALLAQLDRADFDWGTLVTDGKQAVAQRHALGIQFYRHFPRAHVLCESVGSIPLAWEFAEPLLDRGVNLTLLYDETKVNLVQQSIIKGYATQPILKKLIRAGFNINAAAGQMHSPLDLALNKGSLRMARSLLKVGAKPSQQGVSMMKALLHPSIAREIFEAHDRLDTGYDLQGVMKDTMTFLRFGSMHSRKAAVGWPRIAELKDQSRDAQKSLNEGLKVLEALLDRLPADDPERTKCLDALMAGYLLASEGLSSETVGNGQRAVRSPWYRHVEAEIVARLIQAGVEPSRYISDAFVIKNEIEAGTGLKAMLGEGFGSQGKLCTLDVWVEQGLVLEEDDQQRMMSCCDRDSDNPWGDVLASRARQQRLRALQSTECSVESSDQLSGPSL